VLARYLFACMHHIWCWWISRTSNIPEKLDWPLNRSTTPKPTL